MKRLLLVALACAGLLLNGCAGYRLGSMLPKDIATVYVPTFINATTEPQLEVETTRALIAAVQRDGSLRVVNQEQADTVLTVTLKGYNLSPVSYRTDQRTAAREYRITLYASFLMTRRVSSAVVAESPRVIGEGVFPVTGDLTTSKIRGLPVAADDLARRIVQQMVEVW